MIDSAGHTIQLGKEIGRGGEGCVYEVEGQASLAAKIYHKTPLPSEQIAKLETMVSQWSESLESISAWPRSLVFKTPGKPPCGILIPKITGARHLHELYGSTNRRQHFPEAHWHHLVLAARNTAAVFESFHAAGIAVGDVNQGNLMVDQKMCVRMIDCDSVQITRRDQTFFCPVGTPHFTPPELQSKKLRDVYRTKNHDAFGMAILIFHLLFVGRHPFAGRFRGPGDMSIEKAIAERRFAFSKNREATLVDPPPASLRLEDLPTGLADLFESAFRADDANGDARPSARQWVEQLDLLIRQRKTCSFDPCHVYYGQLSSCPWCRIEDDGGPSFFVPVGGVSMLSPKRVEHLDSRIHELRIALFPELRAKRLEPPRMPLLKKLEELPKQTRVDVAALVLLASCVFCFAGIVWWPALALGAVGVLASAGFLLLSQEGQTRRKTVFDFKTWLEQTEQRLAQAARAVTTAHQKRLADFNSAVQDFQQEYKDYGAEGEELKKLLKQHSNTQKDDFLRKRLIRDDFQSISGLTRTMVPMLESFGVDSAFDVDSLNLYSVPNIEPRTTIGLLQWRNQIEQQFVFKPEHGITLQAMKQAEELATQRFKLTQARKVLKAATRLQTLAEMGKIELDRSLTQFDKLAARWQSVAKQFRDSQSLRRTYERLLNSSSITLISIVVGVPTVCLLLYLIFR